ncbi:hypothetical protein M878_04615 [Streptomyces roseochromogenus subsp. oscitans DS 12.976]|uniref:Glycosyl transferase family 28 C-terminal domain-containing protein n=1 Tax=Streptomyces roseochromogenus subsp. oscitans DS 12.976 TaxID=1352936 RepID=V6L380_STRRC|nr:hypothetical protein M878_04615 [Streptomyces roseochromogenus subsp. oscitans DS 12.976]
MPGVPVPVTADQPFWAARPAAIGAATDPLPFTGLPAGRLAEALDRVVRQQSYSRAAAARMAGEDGAGRVLEAVEQVALR